MNKLKVALDVDGVLANFYLSICKRFNKPYETVKQFYIPWLDFSQISKDEEFWENLEVLNPPEAINFDFDIYLTSLPPKMHDARKRWLLKNGFPDKPIVCTNKKLEYCLENDIDVLIDDKPETIKQLVSDKNRKVFPIQYRPYYSEMKCEVRYPVSHLTEVPKILRTIEDFKVIKDTLTKLNIKDLWQWYVYGGWKAFKKEIINYL